MIRVRSIHPAPQKDPAAAAEPRSERGELPEIVHELEIDHQGRTLTLRVVARGDPLLDA